MTLIQETDTEKTGTAKAETGKSPGPRERFIEALERLHREDDRASLARLKRCSGHTLEDRPEIYSLFYRLLPPALAGRKQEEEACFLVASLFALAPERAK